MKKTSKFLAIFLSVCLLLAFLPAVSFADDTGEWAVLSADHSTLTFCVGTRTETGVVRTGEPENVPGTVFEATVLHGNYNFTTLSTGSYAPWSDYAQEITKVSFLDTISPDSTSYWFCDFMSLSEITGIEKLDTSHVTDMGAMFCNCSSLTELDVSHFNTENVQFMGHMFSGCSGLTELDVSGWETGNVTGDGMVSMFSGCSGLTGLDVSGWNTGNVTNMFNMFYGCSNLTSLDVSNWDTGNVTTMYQMFYSCSKLTTLDLSGWNTDKVTTMYQMFCDCSGLTDLNAKNWNTGKVTTMYKMFAGCSNLITLNVIGWNTRNVTSMDWMFSGCSNLTTLNVSGWDTGKVTNMSGMFSFCSSLSSLDVHNWDTGNVTSTAFMFNNCSSLLSLDLSGWDTNNVTEMTWMFYNCSALSSIKLGNQFVFVGGTAAYLPNISAASFNTGYWVSEDHPGLRYRSDDLMNNYDGATMAGTWKWETVKDLNEASIAVIPDQEYTGSAVIPGVTVRYRGVTLTEDTDYRLTYTNNTNPGQATVTVTGINPYKGSVSVNFNIVRTLSGAAIVSIPDQEFTGSPLTPDVTVTLNNTVLSEGTDYDVIYLNNTEPGAAAVIVTGKNFASGMTYGTFRITENEPVKTDLADAVITVADQTFAGGAVTPAVTVTVNGNPLVEGTDYAIERYERNTQPGTGVVFVSGMGNYDGIGYGTFLIAEDVPAPVNLSTASITVADQDYTGYALTPAVTVTVNGDDLTENTDYSLVYVNNTEPGAATVIVTGMGDYTGMAYDTFRITENVPAKISLTTASITVADQDYTGYALTPAVTVTVNGSALTENTDYSLVYVNNTEPGAATVIVTGMGDYTGMAYDTFRITENVPAKISLTTASITVADQDYTGTALTPAVTVKVNDTALTAGTDYDVVFVNNTEPGAAAVIITGIGDYEGMAYETFRINGEGTAVGTPKTDLSDALVNAEDQTYTGEALTPEAIVSLRGSALRAGTDYRTIYINNTETGTAIVVVAGVGDYTGMSYGTFEITKEGEDNPEESGNLLKQFSILDVMKRLFQSIVNAFNKLG